MELRILGPLEVRTDEGVIALPRRRERVLLAALALRPGVVVSTDQLVDAIWGETPPRTAAGSLQNAVSELRKVLGHEVLRTRAPGYVLELEPDAIDARRFERSLQVASARPPAERAEALASALALWRGPALADLADEPFARHEASRLDELRLSTIEERLEAELLLGRGADLVAELESHVAGNPLRERPRGQLMLALYRAGRQAEALEAYQDARRALVDGLGIDPSPALQELERQILRQDPALLSGAEAQPPVPVETPAQLKTVTVLAATLDRVDGLGPEALSAVVNRFLDAVHTAVADYGGRLDRFLGSEAVAVFGVPAAHEDDALRASRSAVELREALSVSEDAIRIGVATGEALVRDGDAPIVGDVVAVAAMLRDAAAPGGILVSEATLSLIRDAVDAGEPITIGARALEARPIGAVSGAYGRQRRMDAPLVGRENDLRVLREALAQATAGQRCVGVTVLGEPGIGKTRLVRELTGALVRGQVLEGRCLPYGKGSTYRPVLDLLSRAGDVVEEEAVAGLLPPGEDGALAARQLAALASSSTVVSRGEALWAVRFFLESVAGDDPLVVVLEDVHWAEPALLDLVEYLVERVSQPVLLLCPARPELLDTRPEWAGGLPGMTVLRLEPLAADDARALLERVTGDELDARARTRVIDRAAGNPLHLEQLATFLLDEGGDPQLEEVPPTIEALLASRLDTLGTTAREALQRAAVLGSQFTRGAVVALSDAGAPVDASLLELTRRRIVAPERSPGRDDTYSFHHVLLRDVAYGSLPTAVRAELHERAAAWLDRDEAGPDELVGYHLEHAYRYRAALRPDDVELPVLADAAGRRLGAAGIRATQAHDPSGVTLLRRAADIAPDGEHRAAVLLELGPWLRRIGDAQGAAHVFAEALRIAQAAAADPLVARAQIEIAWDQAAVRTCLSMASFEELIVELLPAIEAAGDDRGLMRAWQFLGTVRLYGEQMGALEQAARNAAEHATRAGWFPLAALSTIATALVHGPKPVSRALPEIMAMMHELRDNRNAWAALASPAAVIHAMNEEDDVADELLAQSRALLTEYDDRLRIMTGWMPNQLSVLRLRGDDHGARRLLGEWREELSRAGDLAYLSTALVQLADLEVADPSSESESLLREASECASPDDRLVQALLLSVAAKRCVLVGVAGDARQLVADARAVLQESDALNDRARLELDRARVLELLGDHETAAAALAEARQLFHTKGNVRALGAIDKAGAAALT